MAHQTTGRGPDETPPYRSRSSRGEVERSRMETVKAVQFKAIKQLTLVVELQLAIAGEHEPPIAAMIDTPKQERNRFAVIGGANARATATNVEARRSAPEYDRDYER